MKNLIRSVVFNSVSLYIVSQIFSGVRILGGLVELLIAGAVLSLLSFVLKPILGIIAFPFNIITFGAFSIVINAIILYALTLVVKQISISAFTWQGIHFAGFVVPKMEFNTIIAFLVIAALLSLIKIALVWLME